MGAFLFTHGAARLRFGYATWLLRPIWGFRSARLRRPAVLAGERARRRVMRPGSAHWAHVGLSAAPSRCFSRRRSTRGSSEGRAPVTATQDPRLRLAGQLIDEGRFDEAFERLERLEHERPDDIDVLLAGGAGGEGPPTRGESEPAPRRGHTRRQHA
jgi:hypothetical protein